MNELLSKKKNSSSSRLIAAVFLLLIAGLAFGREFSSTPSSPPNPPTPPSVKPEVPTPFAKQGELPPPSQLETRTQSVPGGMVRTDVGIGGISHVHPPSVTPPSPEEILANTPDEEEVVEEIEPRETPPEVKALIAEMEEQAKRPPQELPEDLRRQLMQPPPELPEDLKAQLNAPPPEIPEDIKRALQEQPKIVSIDEVNKFPNPGPSSGETVAPLIPAPVASPNSSEFGG